MNKKLQVFVSSTYNDMKAERQAVIEAILLAGHIPAGMELFAAGDESQLELIKQWIQESDVFMLILGGRYGTIEPASGKSYIQLEYEHANAIGKPYFAAVIDDDFLKHKVKASDDLDGMERENFPAYKDFKEQVTSKICRFFKTMDGLKLIVLESLRKIEQTKELVGWIRSDASPDPAPLIEEIKQLRKENTALREELGNAKAQLPSEERYSGYEFKEIYELLNDNLVQTPEKLKKERDFPSQVSVLALFWNYRKQYCTGMRSYGAEGISDWLVGAISDELMVYGLVDRDETIVYSESFAGRHATRVPVVKITSSGRSFLSRLDRDQELKSQIELFGNEPE